MTPRLEKLEIRCTCRRTIFVWNNNAGLEANGEPRTCPCGAILCIDRKALMDAIKIERRGSEHPAQGASPIKVRP